MNTQKYGGTQILDQRLSVTILFHQTRVFCTPRFWTESAPSRGHLPFKIPCAFLCPERLDKLCLALDILAQYRIHTGLPTFPGLPKVIDYLRAVTHREQYFATG